MNINKKLIKYNFSSRKGVSIKYIVIHDTGNTNIGSNAEAHFRYFNGADRQSSAHYFVDDKQVLQLVEDSNSAWHCGDGKGKYGVLNSNSLGIEICVNRDGNYKKAVETTIELTKYLMKLYSIPLENVVRHYDSSRKICPASMSANNWKAWDEFKQALKVTDEYINLDILGKKVKVKGYFKNNTNYMILDNKEIPIRIVLETLGLAVTGLGNEVVAK